MNPTNCFVTLRYIGDNVDPDVITSVLGIIPSVSHKKGENRKERGKSKYTVGLWGLRSDLSSKRPLEEHIDHILDLVKPKTNSVLMLLDKGYRGDLYCTCTARGDSCRISASPVVMSQILSLNFSITIDLYCLGETTGDSTEESMEEEA
jgi:hypothetical protein